jgi:RNA polymerase sigma factor (sigma-70 family)
MDALAMTNDQSEQNERLSDVFAGERRRLLAYIRRRLPDEVDAEDLLQDVFCELLEAYRLMKPIAHAGAWMMQVAKNRIADIFRRGKPELVQDTEGRMLQEWLPSPEAGPEGQYIRRILIREIEDALAELPPSQRAVFFAHEIDGRSFAEISKETGVGIPTLLSRKHYAVKRLRVRLQRIHEELDSERKSK